MNKLPEKEKNHILYFVSEKMEIIFSVHLLRKLKKKQHFNSMEMNIRPASSQWKLKRKEKAEGKRAVFYHSFLCISQKSTALRSTSSTALRTEQITKMWISEEMHGPSPHQLQGSTAVCSAPLGDTMQQLFPPVWPDISELPLHSSII